MNRCLRLLHTVRYLRPVQIYGRAWFRLVRPRPDLRPAPGLREVPDPLVAMPRREASLTGVNRFCFLGREAQLAGPNRWLVSNADLLWLYNLHYFDDLNAENALQRHARHAELIDDWMTWNPPGESVGWEPYPLSLRIVNWIKWFRAVARTSDHGAVGQPWPSKYAT